MASRQISDLTPSMQIKFRAFAALMFQADIPFILTCTARTVLEQTALYAQGRQSVDGVNALRTLAGLPHITEKQNKKVTWTLQSKHLIDLEDGNLDNNKSRAFDIAITRDGKPVWDVKVDVNHDQYPDYEQAGKIGEAVGLRWGGKFKSPDMPHFEEV